MKIAHFAVFSPNLAGMYATVKDMIRAERMQGIDAQFVDYNIDANGKTFSRVELHDEELITVSPDWAYTNADILIRHSLISEPIVRVGIPVVMAMHGRPEYSYMLEHYGQSPVMSIMCNHETDEKYSAYISFWKEHELFWSMMLPKRKVCYLPSVVDLKRFTLEGQKFSSQEWVGAPNIIVADMWREDITPFNVILAVEKFRQEYCKTAKLHLYGLPPTGRGFVAKFAKKLCATGLTGETNMLVPHLDKVYRTADILVTPHKIATRVVREALASGLPIVAGSGCPYTPYVADARDPEAFAYQIDRCWADLQTDKEGTKKKARETAEKHFGFDALGKAMLDLGNDILNRKRPSLPPIEWNGWTLDPADWVVLRDLLVVKGIKKVVEFGAGSSTQLMDRMGINVHSYETSPEHRERVKRLVTNSTIDIWNGVYPPELGDQYELALIDGPHGGDKREPSYRAVASSSIPFVACHDYKRKEDKGWIDKYFGDWKVVAICEESAQGLLILERSK